MIFSPSHKIALIHVPRTAGMSLRRALETRWTDHVKGHFFGNPVWMYHERARDARERMPDYDEYRTVAFVRNPWDRAVSLWLKTISTQNHASLEDFLRWRPGGPNGQLLDTQFSYVRNHQHEVDVSHVGTYETLENDVLFILGPAVLAAMPRINTIPGRRPYQEYYTPVTRKLVADRYAEDIEQFGYSFDDPTSKLVS